jgi:DNA (cytosine-5)-methyltransferase 1
MSVMPSPGAFALNREMVVDLFAGGGGTSEGIRMALGFSPDFAYNHDPIALAVHMANHPETVHGCRDVRGLDPLTAVPPGPIGLLWLSPDCRHFSKAAGGAPVSASVRDLAWEAVRWAEARNPRLIMLENVQEFLTWCPLTRAGRPNKRLIGKTFREFVAALQRLGYVAEWRVSRACIYGAGTIRERLCLIARCDGAPIIWPEAEFGSPDDPAVTDGRLRPWPIAGDLIDWTLPCPSIFMTPGECEEWYRRTGQRIQRPLVGNTEARIFAALKRYVLNNPNPYIVPDLHHVGGLGDRREIAAAFISHAQQGGRSRSARKPFHTLTASKKDQDQIVTATLINLKGSGPRGHRSAAEPVSALCAGGEHVAAVTAFLVKYFGTAVGQPMSEPLHTLTALPRFGLVMVSGSPFQIADVGMRMLTKREKFNVQSFPPDYKIDVDYQGKPISGVAQSRLVGNSVPPKWAAAHVKANFQPLEMRIAA